MINCMYDACNILIHTMGIGIRGVVEMKVSEARNS